MNDEKIYACIVGDNLFDPESTSYFKFEDLSEIEKRQIQKICERRNIEFLIMPYDK